MVSIGGLKRFKIHLDFYRGNHRNFFFREAALMEGPCAGRGTATGRGQENAKFGTELMMDSWYFESRLVDPFWSKDFGKSKLFFFGGEAG